MTKGDTVAVIAGLLVALLLWTGFYAVPRRSQGAVAVLRVDGKEIARVPVSGASVSHKTVEIPRGQVTIEYGNGKARLLPHDLCPDGICWKTGWISVPGQSAVCVPNHMTLTIEGTKSDIDSIVR